MASNCVDDLKGQMSKSNFELFVLSEAGKPIYSYKNREDLVTLAGVCQALMNYIGDTQNDTLKFILTKSGVRITFATKVPLIIIVVCHHLSGIDPVLMINQIHSQILSIFSAKTLKSLFEQRPTFDLRRLLSGSEKLIDILIDQILKLPFVSINKDEAAERVGDSRANEVNVGDDGTASKQDEPDSQAEGNGTSESKKVARESSPKRSKSKTESVNFTTKAYLSTPGGSISGPRSTMINSIAGQSYVPLSHQHHYHPQRSHLNRAMIPIVLLSSSIRDSVTNTMSSCINAEPGNSVMYGVLFSVKSAIFHDVSGNQVDCDLIAVVNQNNKLPKLSPLDIQLLLTFVAASDSQLSSVESLWLPICLPRFDSSVFMHSHISYLSPVVSHNQRHLNTSQKLCLILLSSNRDDFHKCQLIKHSVGEKLAKINLIISSSARCSSDLFIPTLQLFWYQNMRQSFIYHQSPECTKFNSLVHYMASRMFSSHLKTFWLRIDLENIVLLGWHSPTFQLYAQFDVIISQSEAISAAQNIVKWLKKEEDKFVFKDYM